jgi:hypothetical protein
MFPAGSLYSLEVISVMAHRRRLETKPSGITVDKTGDLSASEHRPRAW